MRRRIIIIAVTAVLLAGAVIIEKHCALPTWQMLLVYLIPYLLVGAPTLKEAAEGIAHGDVFNENFLMTVATLGALCIGFLPGAETEFPEAVFVMLFFAVGELFETYAEGRSRDSISHLMDIRPDTADVERNGRVETVPPEEVRIGEIIVIRPGEKVPLDGTVIEGTSSLNTVALTGESMPRDVSAGDEVISGCINLSGVLRVRTTKSFGESTVSKILRLVESADGQKSRSESFITRFARVYTSLFRHMAAQGTDFPCSLLSLRPGHQCAADIFRRTWRSLAQRHTHQGQQLYGHTCPYRDCRVRQDRNPYQG